jgi:eukaryotic-like serine/threonine-protein kinase
VGIGVLRELQPGDPQIIGPYRLVGQLGDGGMGRVFLGRSAGGRPVAVKVIRSGLAADPDFRARFRREVAAARRVSGLFTAMVVDADVDALEPWLATAYVAGPSLAEAIHDHGPLPLSSVLALAVGLAESLAAIHAAGVVHRDLKPANVLLGQDGPCVIDFGISRAAEATSLTRAGFVIGSPGYMAPEQAEGDEVGPYSDIFSLGAVLAFAASGKPPFGTGSTAALVYRIVHAAPRLDGVPDEIRPLIERCLAKDPRDRPAASDLLAEAEAVQPMTGWLPEPITSGFPDNPVLRVAEFPVLEVKAEDPPTITGPSVLIGGDPEAEPVPPEPEAVSPEPEAVVPEDGELPAEPASATPQAEPAVLAGEPMPAGAEAAALEDRAAALQNDAVPKEAETIAPEPRLAPPEAETAPRELESAGRELTPAPDGAAALRAASAPEPSAAVLPDAGGGLPRRPPRRLVRPLVLGSAAALILVASLATGLALSGGSSHASASHEHGRSTRSAAAVAAPLSVPTSAQVQLATSQPSSSAARITPRSSARSSKRPGAQPSPTPQVVATQAPTTAPASVPSSSRSTPESTPKPKPKPKPTEPTALSVSASGASQESCGVEGAVHSSNGAAVQYSFFDNSSANVEVASIDASGALTWEATLDPGQNFGASTFVGNYWVVERSGGGCLAVLDIDGGGQATVN